MDLIRLNDRIIDASKVTGVSREAGGVVTVFVGGLEGWKFRGEEADRAWSYFLSRAPDAMSGPVLTDPATSAAAAGRDAQWELAFAAWLARQDLGWTFGIPPTNPGAVAAALDTLADSARGVGAYEERERQREEAAAKAAPKT